MLKLESWPYKAVDFCVELSNITWDTKEITQLSVNFCVGLSNMTWDTEEMNSVLSRLNYQDEIKSVNTGRIYECADYGKILKIQTT